MSGSVPARDIGGVTDANARAVERIESALDETPFCASCNAHTLVVAHDDRLWLVCATLQRPATGIRGLLTRLVAHERRLVLSLEPEAAA